MKYPVRILTGVALAGTVACAPPEDTRPLTAQEWSTTKKLIAYGQAKQLPAANYLISHSTVGFGIGKPNGTPQDLVNSINKCDKRLSALVTEENIVFGTNEHAELFNKGASAYFVDAGTEGPTGNPKRDYIVLHPDLMLGDNLYKTLLHEACHTFDDHIPKLDGNGEFETHDDKVELAIESNDLAYMASMFINGYIHSLLLAENQIPSMVRGIQSMYEFESRTAYAVTGDFAEIIFYLETEDSSTIWLDDMQTAFDQHARNDIFAIFNQSGLTADDVYEATVQVEYDVAAHHSQLFEEVHGVIEETQELAAERGEEMDVEARVEELYEEVGIERSEFVEEETVEEQSVNEARRMGRRL